MNECEASNSTEELTSDTAEAAEQPTTAGDNVSFECQEPTEEEVANAMRHSSTSGSEASPNKEIGSSVNEEANNEQTASGSSNGMQSDECSLCPKCGSSEDPQFIHYKKILKPIDANFGAFIWRYCCARKECAEFFGEFYAYDKVSNSFVSVPEDVPVVEEVKTEEEKEPLLDALPAVIENPVISEDSAEDPTAACSLAEQLPPDENKPTDDLVPKTEASSDNAAETPSTSCSSKSSRRQRQSVRKRSAPVSKVKTPVESKKAEKSTNNRTKDATSRSQPKRQQNVPSNPKKQDVAAAPKKLRKGYVYEVVPVIPPPQRNSLNIKSLVVNDYGISNSSERGTQTMGGAHFFSILMDQLVNGQAELCAGSTPEESSSLPSYVARRIMISQQLIKRQSDELSQLQEENKRLHALLSVMNSVVRKFGEEYNSELRHLRDTIGVLKREFSFYQEEFVAEAKKSIDNIQAQKEEVQRKIDDVERKNRLLAARIDLHVKEKEAVEERADGYLREISARDRDVILANKARDRAERKLNDTLYVANNAKCAHCQISDKMRAHLTDVVAEKTVLLEKCRKECTDLQRRADHSDRISRILSKDSEKLKFELNTWKSDAERNLSEISRLKEELKKATAGHSHSKSRDKGETHTPKQASFSNSPALSASDGKSNDSAVSHAQEQRRSITPESVAKISSNTVQHCSQNASSNAAQQQPSQNTSILPTPPEEPDSPFSSWLTKERRSDSSPPLSFFNSTPLPSIRQVTALQAAASPSARRTFPFNGPVIAERSLDKQGTTMASSSSASSAEPMHKNAVKDEEKTPEGNPRLTRDMVRPNQIPGCNGRVRMRSRESDAHTMPSSSKLKEKTLLRTPPKNQNSPMVETHNATDNTQLRFFNIGIPNKIAPAVEKPPMYTGILPRKGPRKRKSSMSDHVNGVTLSPRVSAAHAIPFNGPILLSNGVASASRHGQQHSHSQEAARIRFSSSPLPWHRNDSSSEHSSWNTDAEHSPLPNPLEEKNMYDGNLHPGRPIAQRQRKTYWEP